MTTAVEQRCASPGCRERTPGRFCPEHAEILARVKEALDLEAKRFGHNGDYGTTVGSKKHRPKVPTCCRPCCFEPRERGHAFCVECRDAGWTEEAA